MNDDDKPFPTIKTCELGKRVYEELDERLTSGWGKWTLDLETNVLVHQERADYEVDLDRMATTTEVLDWIFHLTGKNWLTEEDLGHLVRAVAGILRVRFHRGELGQEPDWVHLLGSSGSRE